jgi:hypothetical protein
MKAMVMEDNGWPDEALDTIIGLSHKQPIVTADDLNREMRRPPVPNWTGQAFSRARNLGYIEAVSYQTSTSKSRKNGVLRTWRRRISEGVTQ